MVDKVKLNKEQNKNAFCLSLLIVNFSNIDIVVLLYKTPIAFTQMNYDLRRKMYHDPFILIHFSNKNEHYRAPNKNINTTVFLAAVLFL